MFDNYENLIFAYLDWKNEAEDFHKQFRFYLKNNQVFYLIVKNLDDEENGKVINTETYTSVENFNEVYQILVEDKNKYVRAFKLIY